MSERQTLEKTISFRNYISIGLGAMVGIGWVIYAGSWLQAGGPIGAVLAFALCALLLLPIGACYAEMTAALPVAGGEVAFTYKAFGSLVSFLTGWALALTYISVTPFETIAIGALVETIFPDIASEALYRVNGYKVAWSTLIPGLVSGIVLIWLNLKGSKSSLRFQMWVMYLMLASTLVFTITAFTHGSLDNLTPMFASSGTSWAVAPSSIIAVLVMAPWFLAGFDAIPQAAEEQGLQMKAKQIGIAILASIVIGAIFYILIILAVGMSISSADLSQLLQQKDIMPTAEVFRKSFGFEWAAQLVLFTAMLGLLTTLNGFYIASSRLLFSLGRGGMLPHWFAQLDTNLGTPRNAIVFVGAISLLGPFIGKAALGPIVSSGSLAFTFALLLTAISAVRLRQKAPDLSRPYKAHRLTLYLGVVMAAALVLMMILPMSPGQLSPLEFTVIGVWMLIGLIGYSIRRAKRDMQETERGEMILGDYN